MADERPHARPPRRQVFLSYSRRDRRQVDLLADQLRRRGIDVWIDHTDLLGSEAWPTEIVAAIRRSHAAVVVLSRHSVASEHVSREVQLAGKEDRPIFPVRLEPVDVPDHLAYFLTGRQRYDLFGDGAPGEVQRLVAAVRSPRSRRRRRPTRTGCGPVASMVALAGVLLVPIVVLSILTMSFPPTLDRISGGRTCDGAELAITSIVAAGDSEYDIALRLTSTSGSAMDVSGWDVEARPVGGDAYWVQDSSVPTGASPVVTPDTPLAMTVPVVTFPRVIRGPVVLHASGIRQGDGVLNRCTVTSPPRAP